jgi:hypothetical protein
VGLFRRREPLHERLAREGGLLPSEPRGPWQQVGIHGLQRPREWEVTVTADAPGLDAASVLFVALPDGTLLVEEGPDDSLAPLAEAVEQQLRRPYRARGARLRESLWAVQANRIEVLELPDAPGGEALELTRTGGGRAQLTVDGDPVFGSLPALEERGEREGPEYAVHAERLEGDLWEIRAAPL